MKFFETSGPFIIGVSSALVGSILVIANPQKSDQPTEMTVEESEEPREHWPLPLFYGIRWLDVWGTIRLMWLLEGTTLNRSVRYSARWLPKCVL